MEVYVNKRKISLSPQKSIGKGGEADVYNIGNGIALKLFKTPNHADYQNSPIEQQGAQERINIHQDKLKQFPKNLPRGIIVPNDLVTNKKESKILGYTMDLLLNSEPLLRYSDKNFRQLGILSEVIIEIFNDLYREVRDLHLKKVVIGDFNDLNVLVKKRKSYLIDADSFQFSKFICKMFTARFVDPLLCDYSNGGPMLVKPYNQASDWYAFNVMLMQCLLFVDPYGGIYKPKNAKKRIKQAERPYKKITVFHPDVKYPKPAMPYNVLTDEILHYFHEVFEKDKRGVFPIKMINNLSWKKCPTCQNEYARNICPNCNKIKTGQVVATIKVQGKASSELIFSTKGLILCADYQKGDLRWLYNEDGKFKREDRSVVTNGSVDRQVRYRVQGKKTLLAKNGQIIVMEKNGIVERISVDNFCSLPVFDTNENNYYWLAGGKIYRNDYLGQKYVGDVLKNQTLFWSGPKFGFGFYRAGNINSAFVFNSKNRGVKEDVKTPQIRGQLIDSTCSFSNDWCWFFTTIIDQGKKINQCSIINEKGEVISSYENEFGNDNWLSQIRGKCAVGKLLFMPSDEGIKRIEVVNGDIVVTKEFPQTENFIDASKLLFPGKNGIYAVGARKINLIKIN